ncbi:MAG: Crp/Fnr family transcriptional regulator [Pseudomonadota bacterium]
MPTPFLDQLDPATRRRLEAALTVRRFASAEQIVAYQAPDRDLYFLLKGRARVKIYSETGRVVDFRSLGPGDMFGEVALIDGGERSASVVAETEALVGRINPSDVWHLIEDMPDLNRMLLKRLTRLVRDLTERVLEFSILPGALRLHRELMRMVEVAGVAENTAVLYPSPTHQTLADRISSHREAVSRQLSTLARMGVVRREEGRLVILDVDALRQLAEDPEDR